MVDARPLAHARQSILGQDTELDFTLLYPILGLEKTQTFMS